MYGGLRGAEEWGYPTPSPCTPETPEGGIGCVTGAGMRSADKLDKYATLGKINPRYANRRLRRTSGRATQAAARPQGSRAYHITQLQNPEYTRHYD